MTSADYFNDYVHQFKNERKILMDLKKKMKNFFTLNRKADGGFTLVELIVVIAILSILSGVTIPAYNGYVEKAKIAADDHTLAVMNTAFTAACMDGGHYDMRNLSFAPSASLSENGVTVNNEVNDAFQGYFGGGAFKYYDILGFDRSKGMFVANTVAAIQEAVKETLSVSGFGTKDVLHTLMGTFDQIGNYFSGNNPNFEGGFSLDGLLANAPKDVQDKFNFGKFDMTDDEILAKYCANMTEEQKAALTEAQKNTIRGNAYVLRFAEEAFGKEAEDIMTDVTNLRNALATEVSNQDVVEYYNTLHPENTTDDYETARDALQLMGGTVPAEMIVAIGTSDVKNESGISTLGSMYALAAGFYNSSYVEGNIETDFSSFGTVQAAMTDTGFQKYLESGLATKDVDAYLSAMKYLSTGDYDMTSDSLFQGTGLEMLVGALGSAN